MGEFFIVYMYVERPKTEVKYAGAFLSSIASMFTDCSDVLIYCIMFTWGWLCAAETCREEESMMYTRRELVASKE
jgi:hypothetical protein